MTVYCIIHNHKAERGERIELRVAELNSLFNAFLSQNRESFIKQNLLFQLVLVRPRSERTPLGRMCVRTGQYSNLIRIKFGGDNSSSALKFHVLSTPPEDTL